jgi:hypothetical protein
LGPKKAIKFRPDHSFSECSGERCSNKLSGIIRFESSTSVSLRDTFHLFISGVAGLDITNDYPNGGSRNIGAMLRKSIGMTSEMLRYSRFDPIIEVSKVLPLIFDADFSDLLHFMLRRNFVEIVYTDPVKGYSYVNFLIFNNYSFFLQNFLSYYAFLQTTL